MFGKLDARGWNQESSHSNCGNGRVWKMRADARVHQAIPKSEYVVISVPNRIFENRNEEAGSRKGNRLFAFNSALSTPV